LELLFILFTGFGTLFVGFYFLKKKLHYLNWGILHPRAKSAMINPAKQRALSGQLKAVILAPKLA
jgi:hypothetical protein